MTAKWKRIRPGLYHLNADGDVLAMVERGAETGMWWWATFDGRQILESTGTTSRLAWSKVNAFEAAGVTS
jgi:hypothetical protein